MLDPSATDGVGPWATTTRRLVARHIVGSGLEVGPGHMPFPAGPGASVTAVGRWQPSEQEAALRWHDDAELIEPDIVAQLDTERLHAVPDASQDFVICSHVLEHVAEPIGLLADMHRVLRPGGLLLLILPDRHRTMDRFRDGTTLAHLVAEYEAGVTETDDAHIMEFRANVAVASESSSSLTRGLPTGDTPEERRRLLEKERRESIHAHCWDDQEFVPVLLYGIEHLGWRWELVDAFVADDEGPPGMEFGFVLRVGTIDVTSAARRDQFEASWEVWREYHLDEQYRVVAAQNTIEAHEARLDRIDRSAPMRLYKFGKKMLRRG